MICARRTDRGRWPFATALATAVAILAVPAAAAAAAKDTTIALDGPAARSLSDSGVRLSVTPPATLKGGRLSLPIVAAVANGATATVDHRGAMRLRAGRRDVTLRAVRVSVGARSSLSAAVNGSWRTVATIAANSNRRSVSTDGAYITQASLTLTRSTVRLLRRLLDKPGLAGGRLGTIDLETTGTPTGPPSDIPGAPPAPTVTGPPTPGGATLAKRPAGAVSITGGTVSWAPRPSWLGYLASGGPGSGAIGAAGATWQPDSASFTLPVNGGWWDPAKQNAVINTTGATRFVFPGHAIDIGFANWTYDLASSTPKAIATITAANSDGRSSLGTRAPVGLLKPAGPPAVGADGKTVAWTTIPMTLSAEGVPIYRAYLYDSDQGAVTITATTG